MVELPPELVEYGPRAFLAAFLFLTTIWPGFLVRMWTHVRLINSGRKERRNDQPWERIKGFVKYAIFQLKVAREPYAGVLHAFIFWGFIVLGASIVETVAEVFSPGWRTPFFGLESIGRPVLYLSLDVFALLVLIGVLMAAYRRLVLRPDKLKIGMKTGLLVLGWIGGIVVTLPMLNATHMLLGTYPVGADLAPYSWAFAQSMSGLSAADLHLIQNILLWSHIFLLFSFLAYLPHSKHLHIIMTFPNVYYRDLKPAGALKPIDLEKATQFGASKIVHFTWRQLLDGYACTECGRCQSACPAYATGKPLNPKRLIIQTRDLLLHEERKILGYATDGGTDVKQEVASGEATSSGPEPPAEIKKGELENVIPFIHTEDGIWACTTCMACVEECPVFIEHVDKIVDMRRSMVLMEGKMPEQAQLALTNIERAYNPWGVPNESRGEWRDGHGGDALARIAASSPSSSYDVLFWVGCAGSFDDRNKSVSRSLARLMKEAGINFCILGPEEKCTGDPARRIGNEYLAQQMIKENVSTLSRYRFRRIVTACPHCFNTIKNEYPQFGGDYKVMHHTEFLKELADSGKLNLLPIKGENSTARSKGSKKQSTSGFIPLKATYHDPCYLARYNDLTDPPRELLKDAGHEVVEMRRCYRKTFCCGAGGGRMWMEENIGKRVNIERTEEALATGADLVAVACPFCMTMLSDGVKSKGLEEKVAVKDIVEIVTASRRS
ncbi:MAG TPA: heterodisulfide reductase-related iron-sulfur binding cluster [Thermoplasmata archaeon]|nr:heterodisulfide reductase-related iron-sulfur binding cluster [Thermoplasmata archaeon]